MFPIVSAKLRCNKCWGERIQNISLYIMTIDMINFEKLL